ncbi:hypothetical protein NDU88_000353 [Pleurodeles waltl]|uniref:Uncharacterized protein n=1 Tax=Pleurodeles waltl TaxID=8319 RepID=A0AAV7VT84_PLEWA|nr:hypothetical protein NDU88_000353 [Pleurodeles waltl]
MVRGLRRDLMLQNFLFGTISTREILNQPGQSQEEACADSASGALEAQPGHRSSMPVKRPGSLDPTWSKQRNRRDARPLCWDCRTRSTHPQQASGK